MPPTPRTTDQLLLLATVRLARDHHLPDRYMIGTIAQTIRESDMAWMVDRYQRAVERDADDDMKAYGRHDSNVAIYLMRAAVEGSHLAYPLRAAAQAATGKSAGLGVWQLLVAAMTMLTLRFQGDEAQATLSAYIDQLAAEVPTL